jgi:DNA-binding response OmpR family regulator
MKVLLIEDDQSIARLEKNYLEIEGYEVMVDDKGDLETIMAVIESVHVVILDLMLPYNDGFEICRQIRKKVDIPILIVSAKDQDMDIVLGLGLGATDYIKKPFSPTELVARVRASIANYRRLKEDKQEETLIEIQGVTLDKKQNCVLIGDRMINLTKLEFDVLELLMRNRGHVFSKREIYERVWGQDALGYYETVAVHIRRIREKVEKDSDVNLITTMWGVGYCIK